MAHGEPKAQLKFGGYGMDTIEFGKVSGALGIIIEVLINHNYSPSRRIEGKPDGNYKFVPSGKHNVALLDTNNRRLEFWYTDPDGRDEIRGTLGKITKEITAKINETEKFEREMGERLATH